MSADPDTLLRLDVELALGRYTLEVRQDIPLAGVTGLFGPSGGGKTSLLRIVAGLERRASGSVTCGNATWQDTSSRCHVPAWRRAVGMVFQDARLFEHLDVAGNLRFAADRAATRGRVLPAEDIIAAFDLGPLLRQPIGLLSGGERQRVAIARTLMTEPGLLLLDEPLASLDAARKAEILPYLEEFPKRFGIPVIYVSHSADEMARLANRVIVLDSGKVRATGDATAVLNRLLQSAEPGVEAASIVETHILGHLDALHLTRLGIGGQSIVVPRLAGRETGERVRLHIRAGDVALATREPEGLSFRNVLAGVLKAVHVDEAGAFATATIDIDGTPLQSRLTRHAVQELGLAPGMPVYALLKTASFNQRVASLPLDTPLRA